MAELPIGVALQKTRLAKGLSQYGLFHKTGLLPCYISKIENGHQVPGLEQLVRLASGLETEAWEILKYAQQLQSELEAT